MRLVDTLCLAVGAGIGAMARYAIALRAPSRDELPRGAIATTISDVLASLLIGLMLHWYATGRLAQPAYALLGMGLAGSLGSWSALAVGCAELAHRRDWPMLATYLGGNVLGGVLAAAIGWALAGG
ncbi:fluoride efflux transporter FluC [Arsenicicoccus sp. oral taxon 190]|uniref:fluoride efflux transporter FluC n=1 Tax=Arsenicicoccus sp. oral taxon 190 TaxID=1658671 RepID=UPI0012E0F2BA|nr:CrcB family protein [Arsenicicoccus sp. oral taxon 190]